MPKPKVFVTRRILENGLNMVREFCQADVWPDEIPPSREILLERVRGVDGLLCLLTDRIDAVVMDAAGPGLEVVSSFSVGVDNVDVAAATARGISVGNTPGVLTDATADMAFALLLAAARRILEGARGVRDGRWKTWGPDFLLGAALGASDGRSHGAPRALGCASFLRTLNLLRPPVRKPGLPRNRACQPARWISRRSCASRISSPYTVR